MPLNSNKEQKKEIKRARYYEMDKKKIPRLEMQMRINRSKQPEKQESKYRKGNTYYSAGNVKESDVLPKCGLWRVFRLTAWPLSAATRRP